MTLPRRENRGRSAAAGNRRALIAAAGEVFSEQGLDAPLSAVAKRAGVGQGSLYRHFPDRVTLALAVFEDNVLALEQLAAEPGVTLDALLARITEQTIESVAFVDVVSAGVQDARLDAVTRRVRQTLAGPLREARAAGSVRGSLRTQDLMLAIGMVAALVAKTPSEDRERAANDCWALLRRAMAD